MKAIFSQNYIIIEEFLKDKKSGKRPDTVTHWLKNASKTRYNIPNSQLETFYAFSQDDFTKRSIMETREGMEVGPIAFHFTKYNKTTITTQFDKIYDIFATFINTFYKSQLVHNIQIHILSDNVNILESTELCVFVNNLCVYNTYIDFINVEITNKLKLIDIECSFCIYYTTCPLFTSSSV